MNKRLSLAQYVTIGSMLFGMFFGAGNLIFPTYMGQQAGSHMWLAVLGFLITGVGLPLMGVAALGVSRCNGLKELSSRVGKKYGLFLTCLLYLTIGPCFAIPRCATVPFSVGVEPMLTKGGPIPLAVFSLIFFAVVLWFSLRPNGVLTTVGKVLNPIFLVCLAVLLVAALSHPLGEIAAVEPVGVYADHAFFTGFLEGYNTMDALAGLAFGIIVVDVIRGLGVTEPGEIAKSTVKAGIMSSIMMAIIYIAVTVMGAQSRGVYAPSANGGDALAVISSHFYGSVGALVLAAIITMACLKTSIGLISSCSETFENMTHGRIKYRAWAVIFCVASFLIANVGLTNIITYAVPVLMFLYPLAITLMLLALVGRFFDNDQGVYRWVTGLTLVAAVFDFIKSMAGVLPEGVASALHLSAVVDFGGVILPFYDLGLGWICPALVGFVIGLISRQLRLRRVQA